VLIQGFKVEGLVSWDHMRLALFGLEGLLLGQGWVMFYIAAKGMRHMLFKFIASLKSGGA
jgi:hypothetical protein